jgi:hypothetical protein
VVRRARIGRLRDDGSGRGHPGHQRTRDEQQHYFMTFLDGTPALSFHGTADFDVRRSPFERLLTRKTVAICPRQIGLA